MSKLNFKVHELLPDGRAIISTRGLRRVVLSSTGEILGELLTPNCADAFCRGFNACQGEDGATAKSVRYPQRRTGMARTSRRKPAASA